MVFLLLVSVLFRTPLTFIIAVGGVGGQGGIKMASAKHNRLMDHILVHIVQLKPMIKAQLSGRMASIGVSDVVTVSVYSEKTSLKKLLLLLL